MLSTILILFRFKQKQEEKIKAIRKERKERQKEREAIEGPPKLRSKEDTTSTESTPKLKPVKVKEPLPVKPSTSKVMKTKKKQKL